MSIPNASVHRPSALVAVVLAALLAGCSRSDRAPEADSSLEVCVPRPITLKDVNGILRAPVTRVERGNPDARVCVFRTAMSARIELAVRPSGGTTTVRRWIEGAMPLEATPLRGVGDRAAWQRDLHEVIAERHDVLCDVTAVGEMRDFVDSTDAFVQARLGSLCAKVLGAHP